MIFLHKWLLSSCVTMAILFILSFLFSTINEIPIHPSVLLDDEYPYSRRRKLNRRRGIVIFFLISIFLGAIAAGIWMGIEHLQG